MASFIPAHFPLFFLLLFSLCCISFYNLSVFLIPKRKITLPLYHSSAPFSRPSALPSIKTKQPKKEEEEAHDNMHLCIRTHTIPIRFHRKSPQAGCNTRSICGPHMSPNSRLEILLFRCGEGKQGGGEEKKKKKMVYRINVCANWYAGVHGAFFRSLVSTLVSHRWRRWLRFIPDDDHNEPAFTFRGLSPTLRTRKGLTAAPHVRRPTTLGSVFPELFEWLPPQTRTGMRRYCCTVAASRQGVCLGIKLRDYLA